MLPSHQMKIIHDGAKEYGVKESILFGPALRDPQTANDIDLGVLGIAPQKFFAFYGDLLMKLRKPVDLVDLSEPWKFTDLILQLGKKSMDEL
jgi:predicted nucleotidyltransferase